MSIEVIESEVQQSPAGNFSQWFQKFLAETKDPRDMPDEQELARRCQLLKEIDELRAVILLRHGVHPDSTPMIREMRDHE